MKPLRSSSWSGSMAVTALLAAVTAFGGCSGPEAGPEYLTLGSYDYDRAFAAAVEAARRQRLPAVLRDRRHGVIETDPAKAGSLLEPWYTPDESFAQESESTLAHQRRRARFEFTPVEFRPAETDLDGTLTGPELLPLDRTALDLTAYEGELELRVWVYIERAHTPGLRRSTWSRSKTTRTRIGRAEEASDLEGTFWTPVRRDVDSERRLLALVEAQLATAPPSESASTLEE